MDDGRTDGRTDGWMDGWMSKRVDRIWLLSSERVNTCLRVNE